MYSVFGMPQKEEPYMLLLLLSHDKDLLFFMKAAFIHESLNSINFA